jgi:hypothetical protein
VLRRLEGDVLGERRRVDDCQVSVLRRGLEQMSQPDGLARRDSRAVRGPRILPEGRGGLRIEIEQRDPLAFPFGGDSEAGGERRLADPALLADNR